MRKGHHPVKVEYAGSIPAQTVGDWAQLRGGTRIGPDEPVQPGGLNDSGPLKREPLLGVVRVQVAA